MSRLRAKAQDRIPVGLTLSQTGRECMAELARATGITSESFLLDMVIRVVRKSDEFIRIEQSLSGCYREELPKKASLTVTLSPEGHQCLHEVAEALGVSPSNALELAIRVAMASEELQGFRLKQALLDASRMTSSSALPESGSATSIDTSSLGSTGTAR